MPIGLDTTDELLKLSKPFSLRKLDGYEALLKSKGWSSDAVVCIRDGKTVYVVACNRDEELIVGKGENQRTAWKHAVKQADGVRPRRCPLPVGSSLRNAPGPTRIE